jgi:iron(III) transport system permease protein
MISFARFLPRRGAFGARQFAVAGLILILLFLVLYPMGELLLRSLRDPAGGYTITHYIQAFSRARQYQAYINSLVLGVAVTAFTLVLAVPMAWAIARTDLPFKNMFRAAVFGTYIMPAYLLAIGWILLASPNSGWINKLAMALGGGTTGIFNIYSFAGLVLIITFSTFPLVFILVTAALEAISSEMEEAANILGAGRLKTSVSVTLPLVLPAVIGASIISFLEALSLVGTPTLIAIPARISVVTTELQQFFSYPIRVAAAAAYCMPLLVITVLLLGLRKLVLGRKGYITVTGKSGERRAIRLGVWKWPMVLYAVGVMSLMLVLPAIVLVHAAFAKAWFKAPAWDNYTFENFRYLIFDHSSAMRSVLNTGVYSAMAATLAVLLAGACAYVTVRDLSRLKSVITFLCVVPFVIPGIILAIAIYASFAPPPIALYGTMTILVLAYLIRFLPIAFMSSSSAIGGVHAEMEEAVRILGGTRLVGIWKVVRPLIKKSILAAWLLVFIGATRELSAAMFLYVPATRPMSITLLDLSMENQLELLAALGFMMLAATFVVVLAGWRIIGRDFMSLGGRQ